MKSLIAAVVALAITGCASIPEPPKCDESNKHPLNQTSAAPLAKETPK